MSGKGHAAISAVIRETSGRIWRWVRRAPNAARARLPSPARPLVAGVLLVVPGCGPGSLRPLEPSTRVARTPAVELVLHVSEPCVTLPGGTPMGRPDGVRSHVLPAGRYRPELQDDAGVYFASPSGIQVTEPAPRGSRARPGGIYLSRDGAVAWEYLGDASGISTRQVLARHCRRTLEQTATQR